MKKKYFPPSLKERKVILNPAYTYTNSKGQSCATPQEKMNREAEEAMKNEEWGKLW